MLAMFSHWAKDTMDAENVFGEVVLWEQGIIVITIKL